MSLLSYLNWDCLVISLKHIFFLVIISPNNDHYSVWHNIIKICIFYFFIFLFFLICFRINQRWAPITAWTIKKISLNNYSIFQPMLLFRCNYLICFVRLSAITLKMKGNIFIQYIWQKMFQLVGHDSLIRSFRSNQMSDCELFAQIA